MSRGALQAWSDAAAKGEVAGKPRGTMPYRFSGVLIRRGDGWAWRQWHGSVPGAE